MQDQLLYHYGKIFKAQKSETRMLLSRLLVLEKSSDVNHCIQTLNEALKRIEGDFQTLNFDKKAHQIICEVLIWTHWLENEKVDVGMKDVIKSQILEIRMNLEEVYIVLYYLCQIWPRIESIFRLLGSLTYGVDIMINLLKLLPFEIPDVVSFFVHSITRRNEVEIENILKAIISIDPQAYVGMIRDELLRQKKLFGLLVSLGSCHPIEFLQYVFCHGNYTAVTTFIQRNQQHESFQNYFNVLWSLLISDSVSDMERCSIMHGLCIFASHSIYGNANSDQILQLSMHSKNEKLINLTICYFFLLRISMIDDKKLSMFIQAIWKEKGQERSQGNIEPSPITSEKDASTLEEKSSNVLSMSSTEQVGKETLRLLATLFHAELYEKVESWVRKTTKYSKLSIGRDKLKALHPIFAKVIPVENLMKEILQTRKSSDIIECVYRMTKSKLFRNHYIDPTEWVFSLVQESNVNNLDPNLPKLLTTLIQNSIPHHLYPFQFSIVSLEKIIETLGKAEDMTANALMLYYMLTVNSTPQIENRFSESAIAERNVLSIVEFVSMNRKPLGKFTEKFLGLVAKNQTQLMDIDILLTENFVFPKPRLFDQVAFNNLCENFDSLPHHEIKWVLDSLVNIEDPKMFMEPVIDIFSRLVKQLDSFPDYLMRSYQIVWEKIYQRNPMKLALLTVNAIHVKSFTHEEIYQNILSLFSVHKNCFRNPALVKIFLHVLEFFRIGSEKYVENISSGSRPSTSQKQQKKVKDVFITTQNSAVIQILLEICGLSEPPELPAEYCIQIRKLIGDYIHQRFIQSTILAKIVHFQTYKQSLIPIAVEYISSIHICMDFVMELMNQAELEKQIFGIDLASHLVEKYPLNQSVDIAKHAIMKIRRFGVHGTGTTSSVAQKAITHIMDSLPRIGKAFPFLYPDCVSVMDELKLNYMNNYETAAKMEEAFEKVIDVLIPQMGMNGR